MRSSRRTAWALLASIALHLLVAALVFSFAPERAVAPAPAPSEPLQIEIVSLPAMRAPAPGAVGDVKPPSRATAPAPSRGSRSPASPLEGAPLSGGERATVEPAPPRLSTLVPGPDVLPPSPGASEGEPGDTRRGYTVRNDGSGPSAQELAEVEALEVGERVGGWVKDDLAGIRVANGLVDPWFHEMRRRLEKGAAEAPREAWPGEGKIARDLLDQYKAGAARYGATGNPYAGPRNPVALPDAHSPLARAVELDPGLREFQQRFHAAASLRDFANGDFAGGLVALVEIRQAQDGKLLDARIVRPSGNAKFDQFVLQTAPESILGLPPVPPEVAAARADGIRSLWAFRGALSYKRKLSEFDVKNAGDAAYLAAMGVAGLLTGNFEETTGEVEVVDLRNPRFRCTVKLLRLY